MTKREKRNTILIVLGLTAIFLMFLFHLIKLINSLMIDYNRLIDYTNVKYNETRSHRSVLFFGEEIESVNILVDIIIVLVIVVISLIVYLAIHWSFKENE